MEKNLMRKFFHRHYLKSLVIVNQFNNLPPKVKHKIYIVLIIALVIALVGIGYRVIASITLQHNTVQQAITNVATIPAVHGPKTEDIVLPGNVQAWHEATIYARTNGYIKTWYTDIGARVKEGELLALIETPELDAQLQQAEADLKTAEANSLLAQTTDARWKNLLTTESVSKQDADEKSSSAIANIAMVESARANRDRLKQLVGFERVIAPFDGIITSRTIDIGSLIDEGSDSTKALFHIVQSDRLRIYVKVPQNYSARLTADMETKLVFSEYPGKVFSAKLLSTAEGIDPNTRTLLAEFVAENPDYLLLPGSYTQVHLILPLPETLVRIPVNTLLFRTQGLQVGTIDAENRVVLKSITIGRDFGDEVEVTSGLKSGEAVILNPPDALLNGQKVNIVKTPEAKAVD
jgi:RND family efflux transporter MFP subunit